MPPDESPFINCLATFKRNSTNLAYLNNLQRHFGGFLVKKGTGMTPAADWDNVRTSFTVAMA